MSAELNNSKETSVVKLGEALEHQNTSGRPVKSFVGTNIGNRTFCMVLSLYELQEYTEVANELSNSPFVAQRKLSAEHATEIAKYILKGILASLEKRYIKEKKDIAVISQLIDYLGRQAYLSIPPLVASLRDCERDGASLYVMPLQTHDGETASYKIFLNPGTTLWIVDGQHRRKALQYVFEFLNTVTTLCKYPNKNSLIKAKEKQDVSAPELKIWSDCLGISRSLHVVMEVHLGLGEEEEQQLFHDLNNLQKKVEKSLAFQLDNGNPVNRFIKEVLEDPSFIKSGFEVLDKDKINWTDADKGFTRKDLIAINAILFLNKTNPNKAFPLDIKEKEERAKQFWEQVIEIEDILEESPRQKTVAVQPVVLKALAKLYFDFFFGKNPEWVTPKNQQKLLKGIASIDFSHKNPLWRFYMLSEKEIVANKLSSLREYLPSDTEGNRDLGNFDSNKEFRFGAKHNDIFPIIGDMIRWSLKLPKRTKD